MKKTRKTSPGQKANQNKLARVNKEAVKLIYEAGEKGAAVPTWGKALRTASKKVYKKR